MNSKHNDATAGVTAAYLMICGALGYLFGGLADAGFAVIVGVISPYTLSYLAALLGGVAGAEPAPIDGRRTARRAR